MTALPPTATLSLPHLLIHSIEESVQRFFLDRFGIAIAVETIATDMGVRYQLRHAKPGLLPTSIEKAAFDAYIAGFRAAGTIALDLVAPKGEAS